MFHKDEGEKKKNLTQWILQLIQMYQGKFCRSADIPALILALTEWYKMSPISNQTVGSQATVICLPGNNSAMPTTQVFYTHLKERNFENKEGFLSRYFYSEKVD